MFSKLFKLKGNHPTQLRQLHYIQERTPIAEQYISKIKIVYTGSLSSPDFKGAFFNHGHFQKITRIFSLCPFSLHNWRNFFTHACLVTNNLSAADFVHIDFSQTLKSASWAKDWVYLLFFSLLFLHQNSFTGLLNNSSLH